MCDFPVLLAPLPSEVLKCCSKIWTQGLLIEDSYFQRLKGEGFFESLVCGLLFYFRLVQNRERDAIISFLPKGHDLPSICAGDFF